LSAAKNRRLTNYPPVGVALRALLKGRAGPNKQKTWPAADLLCDSKCITCYNQITGTARL